MGMGGRIGGQGGYEQPQYGGGSPAGPGKGRAPFGQPPAQQQPPYGGGFGGYQQPQFGGGYPSGPGKGRAPMAQPLAPPGQYPGGTALEAVQREQPSIRQEATGLSSAELLELSDEELERYIPTRSLSTSTSTHNFTPSSEDFRKKLQAGLDRQMNLQPGDRGFGVGPRLYNPIDSSPPAIAPPPPPTLRPVSPPPTDWQGRNDFTQDKINSGEWVQDPNQRDQGPPRYVPKAEAEISRRQITERIRRQREDPKWMAENTGVREPRRGEPPGLHQATGGQDHGGGRLGMVQPMPFSSYGSPGKGMRPQPYGRGFGRGFGGGFGGYQPSPYMPPSPYGGSFGGVFNQGYGVPRGIGSLLSSYPSYMPPRMHFNPYVR